MNSGLLQNDFSCKLAEMLKVHKIHEGLRSAYSKSWTGPWTLDSGLWTLDSGLWTLDSGLWTLDSGLWTFPPKLYSPLEKNLYISPHKTPPPKKNSFPQIKNSTTSDFF